MSFSKFQKTIALTSGVLVLSGAIVFIAFAVWQEPTALPPDENVAAPINVGPLTQTKTGSLVVNKLTTSGNKLYLGEGGSQGDIERVNIIQGFDDLHLWSGLSQKSTMYLDNAAANNEGIKFYTQGEERMVVGADGNIYMPGLTDCVLRVDDAGKLVCYSGGSLPGTEEEFDSTEAELAHISQVSQSVPLPGLEESYTVLDEEAIIKIKADLKNTGDSHDFYFRLYINGNLKKELIVRTVDQARTWYWHAKQNDVIKINLVTLPNPRASTGDAWLYNLTFRRKDNIIKITSTGDILYFYNKASTGEMSKAANEYVPAAPSSIAATADGPSITIFTEE